MITFWWGLALRKEKQWRKESVGIEETEGKAALPPRTAHDRINRSRPNDALTSIVDALTRKVVKVIWHVKPFKPFTSTC